MRKEAELIENEYVKGEWQSEIVYAAARARVARNHSATGMNAAPASEPRAKRARRAGVDARVVARRPRGAGASGGGSPAAGLTPAIATA